jgi:hypothetical protein
MRLPLLSGIIADESAEFLQSYPVNLETVAVDNKIAKAQFRMTSGASVLGAGGPGVDRGGILWNGVQHRVMGTKLVKVAADGAVTVLGDVGGTGQSRLWLSTGSAYAAAKSCSTGTDRFSPKSPIPTSARSSICCGSTAIS